MIVAQSEEIKYMVYDDQCKCVQLALAKIYFSCSYFNISLKLIIVL